MECKNRYEREEVIAENIKGFKYILFAPPKNPKTDYDSGLFDAAALGI